MESVEEETQEVRIADEFTKTVRIYDMRTRHDIQVHYDVVVTGPCVSPVWRAMAKKMTVQCWPCAEIFCMNCIDMRGGEEEVYNQC